MPRRRQNPHFRKIVVGYDGSKQADKAVEVAFSLAGCTDCKVLVFSVARPPEPATRVEVDAMLDDARENFEASFKTIAKRARELDVEVETAIAVGHPIQQIVHRAEADHIDLIVLGRRGMSRFEKMLVGSTSEKVLRYAHCPVMVFANAQQRKGNPLKILLIALFGAVGTLTRYGLQGVVQIRVGGAFPYGTLLINLTGCLLLGFLGQLTLNRMLIPPEWRVALTVGFFGGYTTFSSFGWETAKMLEDGEWLRATTYVGASVFAGLLLSITGIHLANKL